MSHDRPTRPARGGGGVRNTLVTLVTVAVVAGLAVVLPGLLPGLAPGLQPGGTSAEAPLPGEGSVPDTPLERTRDGGSYRFSATQPGPDGSAAGREPVAYRPCEPIEVEVNLRGAPDPDDDLRMVLDGLDRVSAATGLDLTYVGGSTRRPSWERGSFEVSREELADPAPVLVAFADAAEVPQLEGQVAGIAGSVIVTDEPGDDGAQPRPRRYLTGEVTLDSDSLAELREQDDGRDVAAAITLHELAHLVGLDHVDDPAELMYAVTTDQRDLGPGDREGLRRLGPGDSGRC